MHCLLSWHFRRDNKTYGKEEEGTNCRETKLGKYFDYRGSWLVKGSLSVYSTVYFPVNVDVGYWIARQLWRRLPCRQDCFYGPLSCCRITINSVLNQYLQQSSERQSCILTCTYFTHIPPFCVKGICACNFLVLKSISSMHWAKGRAAILQVSTGEPQ